MGRYGERIALSGRGRHPVHETVIAAGVLLALIVPGVVTSFDGLPAVLDRVQAALGRSQVAAASVPLTPAPPPAAPAELGPPAPESPVGTVQAAGVSPADVTTVAPPAPDAAILGTGTAPVPRPAPAPVSPVVAQVEREAAALEAMAQQVVEERDTHDKLTSEAATAETIWAAASDRYHRAEERTAEWARSSYLTASVSGRSRPGPLTQLTDGQGLARGTTLDVEELTTEAAAAAGELAAATQSYAIAYRLAADAGGSVTGLETELARRTTVLSRLRVKYRVELAAAQLSTDSYNAALSRRYLSGVELTGGTASPQALAAVRFALAQLGKPYVWGAEGPDTYDCSGLVQTAYAVAGIMLPRTARPQYLSTTPVPVTAMIPGDLLFFGPDAANWNSIHHVGIYLGDGLMVHAPTSGDVVRVAPVWWAEFFGATRVVGALGGTGPAVPPPVTARPPTPAIPGTPPATPGQPTPGTPTPSHSPSPSPAPSPSPSPSPSPTPGPTAGPPTPTPGPPTPTPTPSPTPSCPSPSPSDSPSPTPTPSPSETPGPGCPPTATPTPTPTPAASP
jgi:cell wall-associated NlpC family hydrolase